MAIVHYALCIMHYALKKNYAFNNSSNRSKQWHRERKLDALALKRRSPSLQSHNYGTHRNHGA